MTSKSHPTERPADSTRAARWTRWRADVLLGLVVLLLTAPVLQPLMDQQISRYALTAALWDHQAVAIDAYEDLLGVDYAERGGMLYSDKAPGQPLLGVPAYGLYRAFGGDPATQTATFADRGLWATTFVSAMLPAALLAVAMRRLAARVAPRRATHAALGLSVGTMLLPFGTVLFGHLLAALLGVVAYLVLTAEPHARPWRLAAAGALAGAAVTVEYTTGIIAVAVTVTALALWRWQALWVVVGGAMPAILLATYHTLAFGSPVQTGYHHNVFAKVTGQDEPTDSFLGVLPIEVLPDPGMLLAVLAGERGLLVLTPIVAIGVVGLARLVPTSGAAQRDAIVGLSVLAAYVVLMSGWSNPTAGASPGPRYVVPALPFLAGGVAWLWQRAPAIGWLTAGIGAVTMGLATFTQPLVPRTTTALSEWAGRVADGQTAQTWLTESTGTPWAIVVPILAAAATTVWLLVGQPSGGSEAKAERASGPPRA